MSNFSEWWDAVGIKEMPSAGEPPEHAHIAKLAWEAAIKQAEEIANHHFMVAANDPERFQGHFVAMDIRNEIYKLRPMFDAVRKPVRICSVCAQPWDLGHDTLCGYPGTEKK